MTSMLSYYQALSIIKKEVAKLSMPDDAYVVVEEQTIEIPWGWVFIYNSQQFIETGDDQYQLMGNAPIIINKETGQLRHTGTAYDIDYYIDMYEDELNRNK